MSFLSAAVALKGVVNDKDKQMTAIKITQRYFLNIRIPPFSKFVYRKRENRKNIKDSQPKRYGFKPGKTRQNSQDVADSNSGVKKKYKEVLDLLYAPSTVEIRVIALIEDTPVIKKYSKDCSSFY